MEQHTDYSLLVAELKKRFIPVTLPAIQSNIFYDKKQGASESVNVYVQEIHALFHKAFPQCTTRNKRSRGTRSNIID